MSISSPLALTLTLSVATLLGYGTYRLLYTPDGQTPVPASDLAVTPTSDAPVAAALADALPDALPDFALPNLDGERQSIRSWAGRPMVVNFWATWCAPCLREIPLLKRFQQEHPDIQVIGIAVDREQPVRAFAADMAFNYPVLIGQADAMAAATAFGVDVVVMPYTVFTAADGATLGHHAGELHEAHLTDLTATLAALEAGRIELPAARARIAGLR